MKYNILVVDNEWLDREGLCEQIPCDCLPPVEIYSAASAAEALEIVQHVPVDILLTDIHMPQISGLDFVAELRKTNAVLQVIFISGYDNFKYAQRAITLNASNFLLKPVEDEELLNALQKAISLLPPQDVPLYEEPSGSVAGYVIRFIEKNLSRDVTLNDISKELHYSPNYLGRLFFEETGLHFGECLNQTRMKAAEKLLKSSPHTRIKDIAKMVGYKNSETFARAFQHEYGESPYAYRNRS